MKYLIFVVLACFASSAFCADEGASAAAATSSGESDSSLKIFAKAYVSATDYKMTSLLWNSTNSAEFDIGSAIGVSAEVFRAPKNSFGWDAGVEIDSERNVRATTLTLSSNATTTNYSSPQPKIWVGDIYGNAIYRWNEFYIPAGINGSYVSTKDLAGFGLAGSFGIQFGAGWQFQHFGVEVIDRILNFRTTDTTGDNLGSSQMNSLNVNCKWGWNI